MRLFISVLACLLSLSVFSQTTFTGAISNDWDNPGNWDNGYPSSGNDAIIPFGFHVYIYGFSTVDFDLYNDGVIFIDHYDEFWLENYETIHNGGLIFAHGNFHNYGTLNNKTGGTIIIDQEFHNSGTLNNTTHGTFTISNSMTGYLYNHDDGTINNYGLLTNNGMYADYGGSFNHCGFGYSYAPSNHTANCSVLGCTDSTACNYDSDADIDDDSCWYLDLLINGLDVDDYTNCWYDNPSIDLSVAQPLLSNVYSDNIEWTSGVIDGAISGNITTDAPLQTTVYTVSVTLDGYTCESSVNVNVEESCSEGCTDSAACNFNNIASFDDGSCDYSCCQEAECCGNGTVWDEVNYRCIVANITDTNFDGCTNLNDLMDVLSAYGDCAVEEVVLGCTDIEAINYSEDANEDDGSCEYIFQPSEVDELVFEYYLNFTSPSSCTTPYLEPGEYYLEFSGTWCGGSCWGGHVTDAAFDLNHPYSETPGVPFQVCNWTWNEYCPQGDNSCASFRPTPDVYNPDHIYYYPFTSYGGAENIYGVSDDCCWGDNSGGLTVKVFKIVN